MRSRGSGWNWEGWDAKIQPPVSVARIVFHDDEELLQSETIYSSATQPAGKPAARSIRPSLLGDRRDGGGTVRENRDQGVGARCGEYAFDALVGRQDHELATLILHRTRP